MQCFRCKGTGSRTLLDVTQKKNGRPIVHGLINKPCGYCEGTGKSNSNENQIYYAAIEKGDGAEL